MVRETSIEIYNKIKETGVLSRRRFEVYGVLFENGPLTGGQVKKILVSKQYVNGVSETVRNRITELVKMGAVKELGSVPCPVTGNTSILFDVTANYPKKIKTKPKQLCLICNGTGFVESEVD